MRPLLIAKSLPDSNQSSANAPSLSVGDSGVKTLQVPWPASVALGLTAQPPMHRAQGALQTQQAALLPPFVAASLPRFQMTLAAPQPVLTSPVAIGSQLMYPVNTSPRHSIGGSAFTLQNPAPVVTPALLLNPVNSTASSAAQPPPTLTSKVSDLSIRTYKDGQDLIIFQHAFIVT